MAAIDNDKVRYVTTTNTLDSMAALPNGGTFVAQSVKQEIAHVYRATVDVNALTFTVDKDTGGAADGVGQKVMTFPEGAIAILGAGVSGTLTSAAGTSTTATYVGLGTARAAADDADLTSTEVNVMAKTDAGALVAATPLTVSIWAHPVTAQSLGIQDGTAAAKDVYLNLAATWVKAGGVGTTTVVFDGTITVLFAVIGDD